MTAASSQLLLPSLLDRLLDDAPGVESEPASAQFQTLAQLQQTVRRDLENLLNCRQPCLGWPANLTELNQSLLSYGIPDFTGSNMSSGANREEFRRLIEATIRIQEPRLKAVHVRLLDPADPLDRTLRFRITGRLQVEPAPQTVAYESTLEPTLGRFQLERVET